MLSLGWKMDVFVRFLFDENNEESYKNAAKLIRTRDRWR